MKTKLAALTGSLVLCLCLNAEAQDGYRSLLSVPGSLHFKAVVSESVAGADPVDRRDVTQVVPMLRALAGERGVSQRDVDAILLGYKQATLTRGQRVYELEVWLDEEHIVAIAREVNSQAQARSSVEVRLFDGQETIVVSKGGLTRWKGRQYSALMPLPLLGSNVGSLPVLKEMRHRDSTHSGVKTLSANVLHPNAVAEFDELVYRPGEVDLLESHGYMRLAEVRIGEGRNVSRRWRLKNYKRFGSLVLPSWVCAEELSLGASEVKKRIEYRITFCDRSLPRPEQKSFRTYDEGVVNVADYTVADRIQIYPYNPKCPDFDAMLALKSYRSPDVAKQWFLSVMAIILAIVGLCRFAVWIRLRRTSQS
jgi:hypothetical protein